MDPPCREVGRPDDPAGDAPSAWDTYLVGPENRLAQSAIRALARGEREGSPLIITGPSGSGKTRLLRELAIDRIARSPGSAIALIHAQEFIDACHRAGGGDSPASWAELRARFRGVELLALDDIQGIARSPLALAELEPTLDALEASGAGVAVTSRDVPARWVGWPRRLIDRLRIGLTVRVDMPGPESRRRYLMDRVRMMGLPATAEALDTLAEAADGYRTLEGWLARLALTSRLDRSPIDVAMAARLVDGDAPVTPVATIAQVVHEVARHFGLRPGDLRSASRSAHLVEARHLAILIARELTGASYASIGAGLGGRDPKTIRHAYHKASERLAIDPALAAAENAIRRRWRTDGLGDPP